MQIARRLYLYFIAAVSLGMTAVGLANLLGLALWRMADAFNGSVIQESNVDVRRSLSLYVALVIVALPVWLLHWWLAERTVQRPSPEGDRDRTSAIRALYLTLALAAPLLFLFSSLVEALTRILNRIFGGPASYGFDREFWLLISTILVTLSIMIYHWSVRRRDEAQGALGGEAMWLPRLYFYGAAFAGAMVMLFGMADIIRLLGDALFDRHGIVVTDRWWAQPLSSAIARIVVGVALWGFHWERALRRLRRDDWVGESERRSSLRWLYVYAVLFVVVLVTLRGVSSSLESIFRWILDAPRSSRLTVSTRDILEPLAVAVPFALFWVYQRLIVTETRQDGEQAPMSASLRRLYTYLVAFVGLAFTSVGAAYVLGIVIDLLLGGSRTISVSSHVWRGNVAQFSALAIVGAGAWLWHWNAAERRVAEAGQFERGATTRRVYLYLTLAASLIAILASLAVIIYRVIAAVLDVETGGSLTSAVSTAAGIVVVAGMLFAYHLNVLRVDLAEREIPAGAPVSTRMALTLTVPPGGDVEEVLSELRAQLPEGYALEAESRDRPRSDLPATGQRLERDHA